MTPQFEAKVREIVAAAATPLDAAAIRRQLKGEFAVKPKEKAAFEQWLPSLGLVEWPAAKAGPRYWTRTAEDVAEEAAVRAAATAIPPKKLVATITKGKSGYPKERADALIARLEAEGKLHRQPLLAETKYKLTSKLGEADRAFLHQALQVVLRSLKALGEEIPTLASPDVRHSDIRILDALAQLEPRKGLLVTAQRLRRAVPDLAKQDFDNAVLRLYRSEKVLLHRHSGPFLLPAEERNELIQSGDTFYVGVCWNTGEE
jgi:hypothetical protein